MSFTSVVEQIVGQAAFKSSIFILKAQEPLKLFILSPVDKGIVEVERYLVGRGISRKIIRYCADLRIMYQTRKGKCYNVVFVGCDKGTIPHYAVVRGVYGNFKGDVEGSEKRYSFALLKTKIVYSTSLLVLY